MSEKQDSKIGDMFSWTDYLKTIIFATIGFVVFFLVMYIFARVNPFPALVNSFRRQRLARRRKVDTIGMPLEHIQPMINSAPQVIIPGNMYPYVVPPSAPIVSATHSFLDRIQL